MPKYKIKETKVVTSIRYFESIETEDTPKEVISNLSYEEFSNSGSITVTVEILPEGVEV